MKIDCQWISDNSEAFFSETLGVEERALASEHLKTCLRCRNEVQALQEVDPLIKQVMEFRLMKARAAVLAPKSGFGFRLALAGAGLAVAAALVFAVVIRQNTAPEGIQPIPQPPLQGLQSPGGQDIKGTDSAPTVRTKPDAPDQTASTKRIGPEPIIPEGAPEFAVIDPSGYATSLQDYRGRVLFIGVWSADQPEATQNLQRVYQTFGSRRDVRILGVSRRSQDRLPGTTFPIVFNNGSRLLETQNADFVVIDKESRVQMRGSLAADAKVLIPQIRARLDQLGGR